MNEDKRGAGEFDMDDWCEEKEFTMTWPEWMAFFGY